MKKWFGKKTKSKSLLCFPIGKKGMEVQMIGWWILAIAVLVIMLIGFFILKDKGMNAIEYVRNILRFGR